MKENTKIIEANFPAGTIVRYQQVFPQNPDDQIIGTGIAKITESSQDVLLHEPNTDGVIGIRRPNIENVIVRKDGKSALIISKSAAIIIAYV